MQKLKPSDFTDMTAFAERGVLHIDLAYARPDNLLFGEAIYRLDARLWLHRDLAQIVERAALFCFREYGLNLVLFDGLRTTDAQAAMIKSRRVQENPQWLQEPRLLSPPGAGGHPRGMAVDIGLVGKNGQLLDMGTPFDFLAENPHPDHNPAHRSYLQLPRAAAQNRAILDKCMQHGAQETGQEILFLPQEWWDFRFPASVYESFAPVSDADLPDKMKMAAC